MAKNMQPIAKRCRALGISPAVMGYSKKTSNRNPGGKMRRKKSEYSMQLTEKQKVKFIYGIMEKQFRAYYEKAEKAEGKTGAVLLTLIERRLDNVIFRLGLAATRREARQLVSHSHFTVNGKKVNIPSYLVKVGDVIEVYIKELDPENNRISLGYKKTEDNPWEKFKATYKVGDIVDATIVSITPFGAFAQIMDGVDGLIHISQLADKRVENVKDIVAIGDVVKVKIIDIDIDNKRISISMRALLEDEAEGEDAE